MTDRENRGADLPQRDAGRRSMSEPARTARSFAQAKAASRLRAAAPRLEAVTRRIAQERHER